jgi:hypothetical protein
MRGSLKLVLGSGLALLAITLILVIVNQTAGLVDLASRIHPAAGQAVFVGLMLVYGGLVIGPLASLARLPRRLSVPVSDQGPEFESHLGALSQRLAANPNLGVSPAPVRAEIEAALASLDGKADELIKTTASSIFLSTAISQNGRLDGLLVLVAQSQMVWRVAHLYNQRPAWGELASLYMNVAATTFIVGELQDLDLSEQVEPIISASLGALGSSVPGLKTVSTILVNSVTNGAANAFLTLRVGLIARRYCGAIVAQPRSLIRRSASTEAARLLGGIVSDGTKKITGAIVKAAGNKVSGAVSSVGDYARAKSSSVLSRLRLGRTSKSPTEGA